MEGYSILTNARDLFSNSNNNRKKEEIDDDLVLFNNNGSNHILQTPFVQNPPSSSLLPTEVMEGLIELKSHQRVMKAKFFDQEEQIQLLETELLQLKQQKHGEKREVIEELEREKKLRNDAHSFMIVSKPFTVAWMIGLSVFIFQTGMYVLIVNDQLLRQVVYGIAENPTDIIFGLSPIVSPYVSAAEVVSLLVSYLMQDDMFSAASTLSVLSNDKAFRTFYTSLNNCPIDHQNTFWWRHILLPSILKFCQGFVGVLVTVIVILQNTSIIELFKDFTALVFISNLDELVFAVAMVNMFGKQVQEVALEVENIVIPYDDVLNSPEEVNVKKKRCCAKLYRRAQMISLFALFGCWALVFNLQHSGQFIRQKYPNCHFESDTYREWIKLGNDDCEVRYNNPSCQFDGGDCYKFNLMYPGCQTQFPVKVGNGECDQESNTPECRFDGYDCYNEWFEISCNVKDPDLLADGKCDGGKYNTPECGYDGGDCLQFNKKYPEYKVEKPNLLGDGICNHGNLFKNGEQDRVEFIVASITSDVSLYTSAACGFDAGDCYDYLFPKCESIRPDLMGNGVCDNVVPNQNTKECAWDGGDCIVFNMQNSPIFVLLKT